MLLDVLNLQNIGEVGKLFLPFIAHVLRSVLGKRQSTAINSILPPSKG